MGTGAGNSQGREDCEGRFDGRFPLRGDSDFGSAAADGFDDRTYAPGED